MHTNVSSVFILGMKMMLILLITFPVFCFANNIPSQYTELLSYVQTAPDQGETGTCLFVAATGAMELIANKKYDIKNPLPYGPYDLAESYLVHAAPHASGSGHYFWESAVLKFNWGYGIHINDWPYDAWDGPYESQRPWQSRDWSGMTKIPLPLLETIDLFVVGNKWSTNVLNDSHIKILKEALWKYKSPLLVNYNDNDYWHAILIVGYDDTLPGDCYELTNEECREQRGAFYVRDSFGMKVEIRDYDWFRVKGNAAFVVKEK